MFSNEVDTAKTPLDVFRPGMLASVIDAAGKPVGTAYVNPAALICARILTFDARATIDAAWFAGRIRRALALRERLYPTPHYRLVYGESDGLPGLVIDRFGEVCVVQLNTAGTFNRRIEILAALDEVVQPRGVVVANAPSIRELENIPAVDEALGDVPADAEVIEGGAILRAPLRSGQKTGFYYDQRDNRARLGRYVHGRSVLDVYSYVGAWGIAAVRAGASEVTCVDASGSALAYASANAERNGVSVATREGDALEVMRALEAEGRRFDVTIVDPPALVKRKKDLAAGLKLYERVNRAAIRITAPDGILIASSCSYHVDAAALQRALLGAARAENRRAAILEHHGQPPDHPVHPAMPETEYLKSFFLRLD